MRRLSRLTAVTLWSSLTSMTSGTLRLSGASVSAPGTGISITGALSATSRTGKRTESPAIAAPVRVDS
jgi:hypothetical protein